MLSITCASDVFPGSGGSQPNSTRPLCPLLSNTNSFTKNRPSTRGRTVIRNTPSVYFSFRFSRSACRFRKSRLPTGIELHVTRRILAHPYRSKLVDSSDEFDTPLSSSSA